MVLFGATEDPNDPYCTVFRVPESGATDGTANYTEVPYCRDMETATRSMLLSSMLFPPHGLKPFVWAPTATCDLAIPGVRVTRIFPRIPTPTPTEAVPLIALCTSILTAIATVGIITCLCHRHTHRLIKSVMKPDLQELELLGPYSKSRERLHPLPFSRET